MKHLPVAPAVLQLASGGGARETWPFERRNWERSLGEGRVDEMGGGEGVATTDDRKIRYTIFMVPVVIQYVNQDNMMMIMTMCRSQ